VVDTIADKGIFHKNKGRSRQEPPVGQGQGPGHRCKQQRRLINFRQTALVVQTGGLPFVNGCAVSKTSKPPSGGFFCGR
jgi:hypothetical protein